MSREKALYGLTMANAKILDLDSRVGSLERARTPISSCYPEIR